MCEGAATATICTVVLYLASCVTGTLTDDSLAAHGPLRRDLRRWIDKARHAGLDDESIDDLFQDTFRLMSSEGVA